MATSKPATGALPEHFTYPFTRVPMVERIDDGLACLATITGQPLEGLRSRAYDLGLPRRGPAWVYQDTLAAIGATFGLVVSDWKETSSVSALPNVALLSVDVTKHDYGRFVVWTHFRATDKYTAFHAICDVGDWVEPQNYISTDWKHIRLGKPLWYLEVTPKPGAPAKGKQAT